MCTQIPLSRGIPVNNTTYRSIDLHDPQLATPSHQRDPIYKQAKADKIAMLKKVVTQATERGLLQNLVNAASKQQEVLVAPWNERPDQKLKRESNANAILEIQAATAVAKNAFEGTVQSKKEEELALKKLSDKMEKIPLVSEPGNLNSFVKDELLASENITPESVIENAVNPDIPTEIPVMARVPATNIVAMHFMEELDDFLKELGIHPDILKIVKAIETRPLNDTEFKALQDTIGALRFTRHAIDQGRAHEMSKLGKINARQIQILSNKSTYERYMQYLEMIHDVAIGDRAGYIDQSNRDVIPQNNDDDGIQEVQQMAQSSQSAQSAEPEMEREFVRTRARGQGILAPKPKRRGARYCIENGKFGDVEVDMPLFHKGILKGSVKGKTVIHKPLTIGLEHLLTKRFDKRQDYTDDDMTSYSYMVKKGDVMIPAGTPKGQVVRGKLRGRGLAPSEKVEVIKPIYYNDPKDLIDRLHILLGSIDAGNTNKNLKQEASQLIDILKNRHVITETQAQTMLDSLFNQ
jgi:hypothetical protein